MTFNVLSHFSLVRWCFSVQLSTIYTFDWYDYLAIFCLNHWPTLRNNFGSISTFSSKAVITLVIFANERHSFDDEK